MLLDKVALEAHPKPPMVSVDFLEMMLPAPLAIQELKVGRLAALELTVVVLLADRVVVAVVAVEVDPAEPVALVGPEVKRPEPTDLQD